MTGARLLGLGGGWLRGPAFAGCRCAHPCRPSGTTARSYAGTTARSYAGTTARSYAGTTARSYLAQSAQVPKISTVWAMLT